MAEKKLVRTSDNKVLAGVCGGLGQYFGIDATLVRIAFLVAFLFFGFGPLIYIILWLVMPQG